MFYWLVEQQLRLEAAARLHLLVIETPMAANRLTNQRPLFPSILLFNF